MAWKERCKFIGFLVFLLFFSRNLTFASETVQLPMTVAATGKILVDIRVNGRPLTCILDTGSPAFLVVDEGFVNKLGVDKELLPGSLRFFAEDKGGPTYQVTFDTVDIGSLHYEDVDAITLDYFNRATGTGTMNLPNFYADGILGMGFLESLHIQIDYPHNRLMIVDPPNDLSDPAFSSNFAPVLPVGTSSENLPFLIDTGSTFSIVSEDALHPLGLTPVSLASLPPNLLFKGLAHTDSITIGGEDFRDVTFEIASKFQEYSGRDTFYGIIGYDNLKDWILDLDFPNYSVKLKKP